MTAESQPTKPLTGTKRRWRMIDTVKEPHRPDTGSWITIVRFIKVCVGDRPNLDFFSNNKTQFANLKYIKPTRITTPFSKATAPGPV